MAENIRYTVFKFKDHHGAAGIKEYRISLLDTLYILTVGTVIVIATLLDPPRQSLYFCREDEIAAESIVFYNKL